MSTPLKGRFKPRFPDKYKGDPMNIWFRSSWERDVMHWLDGRSDVVWWMSEERCVWYQNPVTKKNARYFPDFIIKVQENTGQIKTYVIEVKPKRQTIEPKKRSRVTKSYIYECKTFAVNQAKWKAAVEFCEDRRINFKIITEDELGIK